MVDTADTPANDEYPQIDQLIGDNENVNEAAETVAGARYEGYSDAHDVHLLSIAPKDAYEVQRSLAQSGVNPNTSPPADQDYPDVTVSDPDRWLYTVPSRSLE